MLLERAAIFERETTQAALYKSAEDTFSETGFPFSAYVLTDADRRHLDFWKNISAAYDEYDPARSVPRLLLSKL